MAASEHDALGLPRAGLTDSLTDQIALAVREAIETGQLVSGELYSVARLADEFNVSRTPVREALLQLAEAGLGRFERNRGFRILAHSARELAEVFDLRVLLEVPAARVAAAVRSPEVLEHLLMEHDTMQRVAARGEQRQFMRHDERFHHTILAVSCNQRLLSIVSNLRTATAYLGVSTVGSTRILSEHEPILAAFKRRDSDAAGQAMEEHLRATARRLLERIEEASGQGVPDNLISLLGEPSIQR